MGLWDGIVDLGTWAKDGLSDIGTSMKTNPKAWGTGLTALSGLVGAGLQYELGKETNKITQQNNDRNYNLQNSYFQNQLAMQNRDIAKEDSAQLAFGDGFSNGLNSKGSDYRKKRDANGNIITTAPTV